MKKIVCVQFNVKGKITTDIICRSWSVHSRLWYRPPACTPKDEVKNMVKLQKPPQKFEWKKYECTILCESSKFTVKDFSIKVIVMPLSMNGRVILHFVAGRVKQVIR